MYTLDIAECAFADDLAIFAENKQELQRNLEIWKMALAARNLRINLNKTKTMVIGKEDVEVSIILDGQTIEQVYMFKYLGVKIHRDGKMEADLNDRLESTTKVYYAMSNSFIRKKEISRRTKVTVFKTIFRPILTYGSKSWVLTRQKTIKL